MSNLLKVGRFSIVLCTFLAMSLMADASDKLYPGLNCKFYGTQGSDTYFNPSGYGASGLKNTSGSTKYAACPLYKGYDADLESAAIWITSQSASCYLYYKYRNGGAGGYWNVDNMINYTYSWRYYWSGPFSTSLKTATIYCGVPSNAVIYSYYHDE